MIVLQFIFVNAGGGLQFRFAYRQNLFDRFRTIELLPSALLPVLPVQARFCHVGVQHQRFITVQPVRVLAHVVRVAGDPPWLMDHQPRVLRHVDRGTGQTIIDAILAATPSTQISSFALRRESVLKMAKPCITSPPAVDMKIDAAVSPQRRLPHGSH